MTQSEARGQLQRTVQHTLGRRIILLRVACLALLTSEVLASEAGKELLKVSKKTAGERFSITKDLANSLLEVIPAVPGSEPDESVRETPPAGRTAKGRTAKGGKAPKADEPTPSETLDTPDAGGGNPAADIL